MLKMRFSLILFLIPFAFSFSDDGNQILLHKMWPLVEMAAKSVEYLDLPSSNVLNDSKINGQPRSVIYDLILGIVKPAIANSQPIDVNFNTSEVTIEGGKVEGFNNTIIELDSPGKLGYNINNLTVIIPHLQITADRYKFQDLSLMGIVTLNGEGNLTIHLNEIKIYAKMDITYYLSNNTSKFVVKKIPAMELAMGNASIYLENLGGRGEKLSSLLNWIANEVINRLLGEAGDSLQVIITKSGGDCNYEDLKPICDLIGDVMTEIKRKIIP